MSWFRAGFGGEMCSSEYGTKNPNSCYRHPCSAQGILPEVRNVHPGLVFPATVKTVAGGMVHMRQLVLIGSLVATLLYTGAATKYGKVAGAPDTGINGLGDALRATGAVIDRVTIIGWIEVPDNRLEQQVRTALEWTQRVPAETRDLRTLERNGVRYLTLRWVFPTNPAVNWAVRFAQVRQALSRSGGEPVLTVQLEGTTGRTGPARVAKSALDVVDAIRRQPWAGPESASLAGWSPRLPAGPHPTNIQVAARTDAQTGRTRVWVAWPTLQQEY